MRTACFVSLLPLWLNRLLQAFVGGCWVMLGLQFLKDVTELRPAYRHACSAGFRNTAASQSSLVMRHSADHVLAIAEEAHKRRCLREGKPYTKLPVRPHCSVLLAWRSPSSCAFAALPLVALCLTTNHRSLLTSLLAVAHPFRPLAREQEQDASHHQVEDGQTILAWRCSRPPVFSQIVFIQWMSHSSVFWWALP